MTASRAALLCAALLFSGFDTEKAIKTVKWPLIVFFIGLFVIIGAVQTTGLLEKLAGAISALSGGNLLRLLGEDLLDRGVEHVGDRELLTEERAVHRLAGHVVPARPRLVVVHEEEAVVESLLGEGMDFAVDARDQTDPRVADHSEGDHPRLAGQLALRDVVIRHLHGHEGERGLPASQDKESGVVRHPPLPARIRERFVRLRIEGVEHRLVVQERPTLVEVLCGLGRTG